MKEKIICVSTPTTRTYYKATPLAKEFLDKEQNIINTTGTLPDGEVTELAASSATIKHLAGGKLNGKFEVINLTDNSVTFTEEYKDGQLVSITERTHALAEGKHKEGKEGKRIDRKETPQCYLIWRVAAPAGGVVAGAEGDAPGRTAGLSRREAARFHRPDAPDGVDLYGRGPRRERPQVGGDPPAPGRGGDKGGREPLAQRRAWQK